MNLDSDLISFYIFIYVRLKSYALGKEFSFGSKKQKKLNKPITEQSNTMKVKSKKKEPKWERKCLKRLRKFMNLYVEKRERKIK